MTKRVLSVKIVMSNSYKRTLIKKAFYKNFTIKDEGSYLQEKNTICRQNDISYLLLASSFEYYF